jgi:hypothetical protein
VNVLPLSVSRASRAGGFIYGGLTAFEDFRRAEAKRALTALLCCEPPAGCIAIGVPSCRDCVDDGPARRSIGQLPSWSAEVRREAELTSRKMNDD